MKLSQIFIRDFKERSKEWEKQTLPVSSVKKVLLTRFYRGGCFIPSSVYKKYDGGRRINERKSIRDR